MTSALLNCKSFVPPLLEGQLTPPYHTIKRLLGYLQPRTADGHIRRSTYQLLFSMSPSVASRRGAGTARPCPD